MPTFFKNCHYWFWLGCTYIPNKGLSNRWNPFYVRLYLCGFWYRQTSIRWHFHLSSLQSSAQRRQIQALETIRSESSLCVTHFYYPYVQYFMVEHQVHGSVKIKDDKKHSQGRTLLESPCGLTKVRKINESN